MSFQEQLLNWYHQNFRKLPWRETSDPYKIWLSEIMLQQTQVDTVIAYYNRFLESLPNIEALAAAEEDTVYKLWEGLGYYSRARNLMACAKVVTTHHQGLFPRTYEEIIKLPGIGPYTAGAVLSIAFNAAVPAVDGNVMRVISRVYAISEDISNPKTKKIFQERVQQLLPTDRRHFNQALMELGAMICTPKKPCCASCPVEMYCDAKHLNIQSGLPVKTKKIIKKTVHVDIAYIKYEHKVLIVKRTQAGLLSGMWGFPMVEAEQPSDNLEALEWMVEDQYGLKIVLNKEKAVGKHVFTHLIWEMHLYEFEASQQVNIDYPVIQWVEEAQLNQYPFPTAFKKLITA